MVLFPGGNDILLIISSNTGIFLTLIPIISMARSFEKRIGNNGWERMGRRPLAALSSPSLRDPSPPSHPVARHRGDLQRRRGLRHLHVRLERAPLPGEPLLPLSRDRLSLRRRARLPPRDGLRRDVRGGRE